ncbi:hypothetical protein BH09SUM1_BH09SUM1_13440 [soil metagenome]
MRISTPRRWTGVLPALVVLLAVVTSFSGCHKKTPQERITEALELVQQNQVPLALLKLKDLVAENPDDPAAIDARLGLANLYARVGGKENYRNALAQLEQVYKKTGIADERGVGAYLGAIRINMELGDIEKATALAKDGIAAVTEPASKQEMEFTYYGLLLSGDDKARQQEGIDYYRKLAMEATEPNTRGRARELLADFFRSNKRYEESNEVYQQYIAKYPDDTVNPQLVIAQALNYHIAKDDAKAKELFATGAEQLQKQIDSELNKESRLQKQNDLAQFYQAMDDADGAEKVLRLIMKENVGTRPALDAQGAIGSMYASLGMWDKAEEHFKQMARENPNDIGRNAEAMVQRIKAARQHYEQAAAVDRQTSGTMTGTKPADAPTSGSSQKIPAETKTP